MSEWLPFVGLAFSVVFEQHETGNWYIERNGGKLDFEDPKLAVRDSLVHAWGVNASVRRVDDFSFRYSLKYRIDVSTSDTDWFVVSAPYRQVVLAKCVAETNFWFHNENSKRDKYFYLDLYTFGTSSKSYERTTVRQCNPLVPSHYEVESTGLQMVEQLVWRKVKVPISSIVKNYSNE